MWVDRDEGADSESCAPVALGGPRWLLSQSFWGLHLLHRRLSSLCLGRPLGALGLWCPNCHLPVGALGHLLT